MNKLQQEAIANYLEFHLLSMVEHVEDNIDGFTKAKMYNHAYDVLNDMKDALKNINETLDTPL
jgi:hypothetical protein